MYHQKLKSEYDSHIMSKRNYAEAIQGNTQHTGFREITEMEQNRHGKMNK